MTRRSSENAGCLIALQELSTKWTGATNSNVDSNVFGAAAAATPELRQSIQSEAIFARSRDRAELWRLCGHHHPFVTRYMYPRTIRLAAEKREPSADDVEVSGARVPDPKRVAVTEVREQCRLGSHAGFWQEQRQKNKNDRNHDSWILQPQELGEGLNLLPARSRAALSRERARRLCMRSDLNGPTGATSALQRGSPVVRGALFEALSFCALDSPPTVKGPGTRCGAPQSRFWPLPPRSGVQSEPRWPDE